MDNGVQFTSRAFKKFLGDMGIKQQLTAPYTPQENWTERANRMVKTMVAQFAVQIQSNWDERWPQIMLAVNSSVSECTGLFWLYTVIDFTSPVICKIRQQERTL